MRDRVTAENLLDLMQAPPEIEPVDPDGDVVQGRPDEVLTLAHSRIRHLSSAEIELHRHTDGRWMWSVSYHFCDRGGSYKVGPKWGRFARDRQSALYWATQELIRATRNVADDSEARRIAAWVGKL